MKRLGPPCEVPVCAPFRLDLTVDALRRLSSNAVDVVDSTGTYYRALSGQSRSIILAVRQRDALTLEFRSTQSNTEQLRPIVERLLGTAIDLEPWYARSRKIGWLGRLAAALRGLKPPRYPTLWESCVHAIVFQQISIYAAAAILRRVVERIGEIVSIPRVRCIVFPPAERWLSASDADLRDAGLSRNKVAHLRSAAAAVLEGAIDEPTLQKLSSHEALQRLCSVRGIGPWSASIVLLRGMGRLDVFPLRDSGVARSLTLLSGDAEIDQAALISALEPTQGMLYYHLLLGRLRNLVPS